MGEGLRAYYTDVSTNILCVQCRRPMWMRTARHNAKTPDEHFTETMVCPTCDMIGPARA